MLQGLPEPAQRFFKFAITPGTPLHKVAQISMQGRLGLGNRETPRYIKMRARQILAAPQGFIWRLKAAKGLICMSGSDGSVQGQSWTRFWLFGLIPVARAGGSKDHALASFGRYVAEAIFWTPAAVLPGDQVEWQAVDENCARMIMTHMDLRQAVDIVVDSQGRIIKVFFQRWTDANPARQFQLQPFGGYLSAYKDFGGFRLPTRVEAGNFFETEEYFASYLAEVDSVSFDK